VGVGDVLADWSRSSLRPSSIPPSRLLMITAPRAMAPRVRRYIQRGLFERHKLLFALMLTNKILVSAGKVLPLFGEGFGCILASRSAPHPTPNHGGKALKLDQSVQDPKRLYHQLHPNPKPQPYPPRSSPPTWTSS